MRCNQSQGTCTTWRQRQPLAQSEPPVASTIERRPWVTPNLKTLEGVNEVVKFIEKRGMLTADAAPAEA